MDVIQIVSQSSYCLLAASAFIMAYFSVLFFFSSTFLLTNILYFRNLLEGVSETANMEKRVTATLFIVKLFVDVRTCS